MKAAGVDGQFAQSSSGKSLFSFWLRRPIYRRGLSPLTRKETRPCHGQLRHLSKCASALRSTAICRPSFEQCPPAAACGRHTIAIVLGSALTACPYGNRLGGRMSRHGAGTNSRANWLPGSLVLRSAEVGGFPDASDMRQTVAVADAAHALAEKQLTCSSKPP